MKARITKILPDAKRPPIKAEVGSRRKRYIGKGLQSKSGSFYGSKLMNLAAKKGPMGTR